MAPHLDFGFHGRSMIIRAGTGQQTIFRAIILQQGFGFFVMVTGVNFQAHQTGFSKVFDHLELGIQLEASRRDGPAAEYRRPV